jgi:hypothetical protein
MFRAWDVVLLVAVAAARCSVCSCECMCLLLMVRIGRLKAPCGAVLYIHVCV